MRRCRDGQGLRPDEWGVRVSGDGVREYCQYVDSVGVSCRVYFRAVLIFLWFDRYRFVSQKVFKNIVLGLSQTHKNLLNFLSLIFVVCKWIGLGAPIGTMLTGSQKFIQKSKHLRKLFGGGYVTTIQSNPKFRYNQNPPPFTLIHFKNPPHLVNYCYFGSHFCSDFMSFLECDNLVYWPHRHCIHSHTSRPCPPTTQTQNS